jgi:hypothetical protein
MQGLIDSGVTSKPGRLRSPNRRHAVSSIVRTAASVTGRQAERRRRKTSAAPHNCSPNARHPAKPTDDAIRTSEGTRDRRSMDSTLVWAEMGDDTAGALTAGAEGLATD